jgi:hypothetical protein
MNGPNPYELVDTPFSKDKMEAWRAQSIALGAGGALAAFHRLYDLVRNDAADAAARADEAEARKALVAHLCDQVAAMQERINRLADALEERQRADEEAARQQHRLDEEEIELPPDFDRSQDLPPSAIGDGDADTHQHQPGGELHSLSPKDEPPSELPEPPHETEANTRKSDAGKVPLSYGNVPMSYVKGAPKDQADDLPEGLVEEPLEVPKPKGSVIPPPTALFGN